MQGHLFLIGFMGSGKSRWGARLAAQFGLPFVDLDHRIATGEQQSIAEIFAERGEAGFRLLEQQYLQELAALPPGIVSLGGGTPYFFDNMDWINQQGHSIYLKVPLETLIERLQRKAEQRPLLAKLPREAWPEMLGKMLRQRAPYYQQAHQILEYAGDDEVFFEQLCLAVEFWNAPF